MLEFGPALPTVTKAVMAESVEQGSGGREKLLLCAENLSAKDKPKDEADFRGILAAAVGSTKEKELAAQFIPRFFKLFPNLSAEGINAQLDLCEDDDLGIRIQAIRGLPYLCKDMREHLAKIADVLGQLLVADNPQEQATVQTALMQVLRWAPKEGLNALFKHIESADDNVRERVIAFIKAKILPAKNSLLQPEKEMERHITNLIKGLQDVTGDEFTMFMDFLKQLSIFKDDRSHERMQELVEIVEGQADLNSKFDIADLDHVERVLACLHMALPFYAGGGSNAKFLSFIGKHVLPDFGSLPEDKQEELLKNLAESSPFTSPGDARALLQPVVSLLKELMPKSEGELELNLAYIEALLYAFHQLAFKVPSATNSLCGYKFVTGQPSDRLGEDFSELHADWVARLAFVQKQVKAAMETQGKGKASSANGDSAPAKGLEKASADRLRQSRSNIEKLTKGLHARTPGFLSGKAAPVLSWKAEEERAEGAKRLSEKKAVAEAPSDGAKRPASGVAAAGNSQKRARKDTSADNVGGTHIATKALQGITAVGEKGAGPAHGGRGRVPGAGRRPWRRSNR